MVVETDKIFELVAKAAVEAEEGVENEIINIIIQKINNVWH